VYILVPVYILVYIFVYVIGYIQVYIMSNNKMYLGEFSINEVIMDHMSVTDDFPVHVGNAVLQYSKLHFLKFVYFLWEHVIPGSIRLVYCDTDSIGKFIYNMFLYIHVYTLEYIHVYISVYRHVYIHVHIYVYIQVHAYMIFYF